LLGDVVFMLVAKDPDALWDPIGGPLIRIAVGGERGWPLSSFVQWIDGGVLLAGAIYAGRHGAGWIASDQGQRRIARGMVVGLAALAALVGGAAAAGRLDGLTAQLISHGHLLVLVVLGVAIGASRN